MVGVSVKRNSKLFQLLSENLKKQDVRLGRRGRWRVRQRKGRRTRETLGGMITLFLVKCITRKGKKRR